MTTDYIVVDPNLWRLALVVITSACALGIGYLLGSSGRVSGPIAPPHTGPIDPSARRSAVAVAPTPGNSPDPQLIRALIGAYDSSSEESVCLFITQELGRAGIDRVDIAPGSVFDPTIARCVGTDVAPEPGVDGLVARTERPGWIRGDGGTTYRTADVTIWKATR